MQNCSSYLWQVMSKSIQNNTIIRSHLTSNFKNSQCHRSNFETWYLGALEMYDEGSLWITLNPTTTIMKFPLLLFYQNHKFTELIYNKLIFLKKFRNKCYIKFRVYVLTFLCSIKQCSVFWCVTYFNNFCTSQQLHDKSRCYNWWYSQFHKRSSVWSQDNTDPIKRICRVGTHDTKKWNL